MGGAVSDSSDSALRKDVDELVLDDEDNRDDEDRSDGNGDEEIEETGCPPLWPWISRVPREFSLTPERKLDAFCLLWCLRKVRKKVDHQGGITQSGASIVFLSVQGTCEKHTFTKKPTRTWYSRQD